MSILSKPTNQMQASEERVNELKHDMNSGKSMEMNLEKSKTFCETQMKALDKKYNGNQPSNNVFHRNFVTKLIKII